MKELTPDEIQLILEAIQDQLVRIEDKHPFPPENPYEEELVREYLRLKEIQTKMEN
jgi:hypothetical protein